jgi:hypothetical protein
MPGKPRTKEKLQEENRNRHLVGLLNNAFHRKALSLLDTIESSTVFGQ